MGALAGFAPIIGGLISGAASLFGGSERDDNANSAAYAQQEFQRYMSNTAHQREVDDLKLAGLNPMLTGKYQGASTPQGAMAVPQDRVTPAVNTGLAAATNAANLKLIEAQVRKTQTEADESASRRDVNVATLPKLSSEVGHLDSGSALDVQRKIREEAETESIGWRDALRRQEARLAGLRGDRETLETTYRLQDWPKIQSERDAWASWYGRNVMPFTPSFQQLGNSAAQFMRMPRSFGEFFRRGGR